MNTEGLMPVIRADGVLMHLGGKTLIRGAVWNVGTVYNLIKYTYGPFSWIL